MLARLDMVLTDHQALAPTFSSGPPDVYEERVADWEEDFDNPKFWNVVAEHEGAIVGSAVGCALEVSSIHTGLADPTGRRSWVSPRSSPRRAASAPGGLSARRFRPGHCPRATPASSPMAGDQYISSRAWRGLGYRDTFTRVHRFVGH